MGSIFNLKIGPKFKDWFLKEENFLEWGPPKLDKLCDIFFRSISSNLYKNNSFNRMGVGLHIEDELITTEDIYFGSWWS